MRGLYQASMGCLAIRSDGHICGNELLYTPRRERAVVPLCGHHHVHFENQFRERFRWEEEERLEKAVAWQERKEKMAEATGTIYFALCSNGLIKIGRTQNMKRRWPQLARDYQALELLGTCRGYCRRESRLHQKFFALREHGEFHRPEEPLLTFIQRVAA